MWIKAGRTFIFITSKTFRTSIRTIYANSILFKCPLRAHFNTKVIVFKITAFFTIFSKGTYAMLASFNTVCTK
jgi:hypothetical protein